MNIDFFQDVETIILKDGKSLKDNLETLKGNKKSLFKKEQKNLFEY